MLLEIHLPTIRDLVAFGEVGHRHDDFFPAA
jgi:hypothetical protein